MFGALFHPFSDDDNVVFDLDWDDLRRALLFYDELMFAETGFWEKDYGPQVKWLIENGHARSLSVDREVNFSYQYLGGRRAADGDKIDYGPTSFFVRRLGIMEKEKPGFWHMQVPCRGVIEDGKRLYFTNDEAEDSFQAVSSGQGDAALGAWGAMRYEYLCPPSQRFQQDLASGKHEAILNLVRCIPIPDKDVPFEEIIEFKRAHSSARMAFWKYILDFSDRDYGHNSTRVFLHELENLLNEYAALQISRFGKCVFVSGKIALGSASAIATSLGTYQGLTSTGLEETTRIGLSAAAGACVFLSMIPSRGYFFERKGPIDFVKAIDTL